MRSCMARRYFRCGRQVGVSHQAHEHARIISLDGAGEIVAHILWAKFAAMVYSLLTLLLVDSAPYRRLPNNQERVSEVVLGLVFKR